jgi:hypothetical protein
MLLERVGKDGFEHAARRQKRQTKLPLCEGVTAIPIRLFEDRTQAGIAHELEAPDVRRGRRPTVDRRLTTVDHRLSRDRYRLLRFLEDIENPLDDDRHVDFFNLPACRRVDEEGVTEFTREPVCLAAA